jgi:hypothetical protein
MSKLKSEPHQQECSNPGYDDHWTCPGCYEDLPTRRTGTVTCTGCDRKVECTLDTQPVCVARLVEG